MPNPVTHKYFARDVLKNSSNHIIKSINNNLKTYELFSSGFDPFFTYQQLHKKEPLGDLGHNTKTDIYFLNYIDLIKKYGYENNSNILASLYGQLTHYILDSKFHPYVIHKAGEYYKEKPWTYKYKGKHNELEWNLDAYFCEKREHKKFKDFKINQIYSTEMFDKDLINILNENYQYVFNIKEGGKKYKKSIKLVKLGLKYTIEDKHGIKKNIYKAIDKITPNKEKVLSVFSTYIKEIDHSILNEEHNIWYNPWDNTIKSRQSLIELYNESMDKCVTLFEETYKYINNKIEKEQYIKTLGKSSYVTGLNWNEQKEIKYIEY